MNKRLILVLVFYLALVTPTAKALTNKILEEQLNHDANRFNLKDHHPDDAGEYSAWGETFNLSETAWITNVTLWLYDSGNPTCTLQVRLYNHDNGLYGTGGLPETPSIANSTTLTAPLTGVATAYTFNFTGDDRIQLDGGQTYVFALVAYGGVLNGANYIRGYEIIPSVYDGNAVYFRDEGAGSQWFNNSDVDLQFQIRGDVLWGEVGDLIDDAFSYFNIIGYMTQVINYIGALSGYLADSMINAVSVITQQIRIVLVIYTWVIRWFTRFVDMFLTMGGIITGLLDGTGAIVTQFGNWWTLIELNTWYELIVLLTIIAWFDSVAKRGRTQGEITVFFNDLQVATNIMSYFLSVFSFIIDAVVSNVFRLFDAIT